MQCVYLSVSNIFRQVHNLRRQYPTLRTQGYRGLDSVHTTNAVLPEGPTGATQTHIH